MRTARLRPSLRRLLGLLGYVPRPAVASTVSLAVFADGRKSLALPVGAAFRSGAFDGQPPQLFELTATAAAHPLTNRWTLGRPKQTVAGTGSVLLLEPGTARLKTNDIVRVSVVSNTAATAVRTVTSVEPFEDIGRTRYVRVTFNTSLGLPTVAPNQIIVASPSQTAPRSGRW